MKIAKYQIGVIILLISLVGLAYFFDFTPRVKSYIERKTIERENQKVVESIDQKNIISSKEVVPDQEPADEEEKIVATPESTPISMPDEIFLEVPFICQAPLQTEQNWTYHEESCEEAALLQAFLFENNMTVTKEEANQIIFDMIEWQEGFFGSHKDLYADDMKAFIMNFYGLTDQQVKVTQEATLEDLKQELASGHPVITPVTSAMLNNPYYPYPGYHMLTVKGYTPERIITNDNGTRRGEDYTYNIDVFMKALEDAGGFIITLDLSSS